MRYESQTKPKGQIFTFSRNHQVEARIMGLYMSDMKIKVFQIYVLLLKELSDKL